MNIGIFDSGIGGLVTMRSIVKKLPEYDYVYLGDTLHLPYGEKTERQIFTYLKQAIKYLFETKNCALVIVACNTASARALRKIQRGYLKKHFPNRRVLGMIIPLAEEVAGKKRIGIIGTRSTISSQTYEKEILKLSPSANIFSQATPKLVPLIEEGKTTEAKRELAIYLQPFIKKHIDALILGCTHYPLLKKEVRKMLPKEITIISQDTIIPKKLEQYLQKHIDIKKKLNKKNKREFLVTKLTPTLAKLARTWFGKNTQLMKVVLGK